MNNEELIFEINQRFKLGDIYILKRKKNRLKDYEIELIAETMKVSVVRVILAMNQLYRGEIKIGDVNKKFQAKIPRPSRACTQERGIVHSRLAGQEYKVSNHINLMTL